ncbi:MAG: hypothetical protein MnENMB40S_35560 [Rhizobiaceae bacterium MnEN-MB40S]|nr:MAG: hypothetical protein MnENMB40S_35560 [Rhizobiaceae bacterium MnEN-MB40S]
MRGRKVLLLTILVFGAYCLWMIGPYIRSTLVRDSAITTWSRMAVAPIEGRIVTELPLAGSIVGSDGLVATIENPLLFDEKRSVDDMRQQVATAQSNAAEATDQLDDIESLERRRVSQRDQSAEVFHETLETEIQTLRRQIAVNAKRIDVLQRIVDRSQTLTERGVGSNADLDEAALRLSDANARAAELNAELAFALLRDKAAESGVFIAADGSTPDWLRYGELELQLQQQKLRHELDRANARVDDAKRGLALATTALAELSAANVTAPGGSQIFSVLAAPDAAVTAGQPIVEWINCEALLVDVPVPDAEIPLIRKGDRAEVVMEGESSVRDATVLLTRGSASPIGRKDLAAVAKGRTAGVAQALLSLDREGMGPDRCPIGQSAYVRFPGVGLFDVLKARLRL